MTRMLSTIAVIGVASGVLACADLPPGPTPLVRSTQTPGSNNAAAALPATPQPRAALTGPRTFEISLSDDDPTYPLGKSYDPDTPRFCGPCQVLALGPTLPDSIVLTWTADLTLLAWVEGEARRGAARSGATVIIEEHSVGSRFGAAFGRQLRLTRRPAWGLVDNPRVKVGIPLTEPRTRLGAALPIAVTVN